VNPEKVRIFSSHYRFFHIVESITMIKFSKTIPNPVIGKTSGSFHSIHAANPDLIFFNNKYHLYFRGQGEKRSDEIGVAFASPEKFNGIDWEMYESNPIIEVSEDPNDFDAWHILDPAAIEINGKIFLYYSGHPKDKTKLFSTCLAISDDGVTFKKSEIKPIVYGAICPEIIEFNNTYYLFYQKLSKEKYFNIYCNTSKDGINFNPENEIMVFSPSRVTGAFDEFSISTVRLWQEGDTFFMTYGGCNKYFDYPIGFGLARSKDLIHWERYPNNPVFTRGEAGSWDEGALWFATVFKKESRYYLWYEGTGTGLNVNSKDSTKKSDIARNDDYGGYAQFSFSQIGLATFDGNIKDIWK
jgi:predicted GH43/DUF377 family glycosyl hydrolase